MDVWRTIADRKIAEAMEEGAFDYLSGAGKPLDLSEDPFERPDLRMAHRLLRNNGFAPAWIEESREIEAALQRARAELRTGGDPERFRRAAAELNRRIAAFNLSAPVPSVHKLPVDVEAELAQSG